MRTTIDDAAHRNRNEITRAAILPCRVLALGVAGLRRHARARDAGREPGAENHVRGGGVG